jgi:hypothetical protein
MVLGENFKNNVNMNFVTPFPQGAQFLLLQDNKTKNLSARADMLSNPNGFDRNNTFNTQSCLQKTSNFSMNANQSLIEDFDAVRDLHDRNHIGTPVQNAWSEGIEGFTNNSIFSRYKEPRYKEPDNAIYKKNLQDKNSTIEMQEKLFNQANQYNRELKDMYNQADAFSKTNPRNNPYKGKNVSLSSGAKGYVTERGIFKWYPNSTVIDSTQGKNGCGTGLDYIDLGIDGSFKNVGSIIQSSPPMLVGTPMKQGQACGYAGSNVQITQGVNPSLINDNYRGCYKTNTDFSEQSDLGTTTKQACKSRALDLGKTLFALTNYKEDKGTCWVGSADYSNKPQDGVVDKIVEKEGNSILTGTNMFAGKINNTNQIGGGLLRDGTLAIGLVPGGASTAGDVFGLTNEQGGMGHFIIDGAPPIAGCNKYIGGSVNIPDGSDSTLTWNNNNCLKMVAPNVNV